MLLNYSETIQYKNFNHLGDTGGSKFMFTHQPNNSARAATVEPPPVKSTPEVDLDVLMAIQSLYDEDAFIYVHCYFDNQWKDMLIRIWKTTYLIDSTSASRAKLMHVENISYAPQWTMIADGKKHHFLLIFSSLPRDCKVFDLVEEISQPGGFFIPGIARNTTDVYHVNIP